ncbi:MAG: YdcH family protein [Pseudomonadota bacterium]
MTEAEVESLHQRINALRAEHRQLDSLVNRLCATQVYNDQRLQELKLRRLRVKDRLAALERKLKQ